MEKKTMGTLIAALRKANGMTQQELADRLNVSNKAVSRWERDESAPDLSLIPALSEIFDITCDELLRGERTAAPPTERHEAKTERQLRSLVNRTLSKFKTLIWISIALSAVGLVCMFGISYGFYRPVIGFAVMLLFAVAAFAVAVIAANKTKEIKTDNELFDAADPALRATWDRCLGSFSFGAFFAAASVILLSLPLLCTAAADAYSVLTFDSYLVYFVPIALFLMLVFYGTRRPLSARIAGQPLPERPPEAARILRMDLLQWGAAAVATLLLFVSPYFEFRAPDWVPLIFSIAALAFLFSAVVCFVLFLLKNREERKALLLPGIRNMLYFPAVIWMASFHSPGWIEDITEAGVQYTHYDFYRTEILWRSIVWVLAVTVGFEVLKRILSRKAGK